MGSETCRGCRQGTLGQGSSSEFRTLTKPLSARQGQGFWQVFSMGFPTLIFPFFLFSNPTKSHLSQCVTCLISYQQPPHNYTINNSSNNNEGWITRYFFYTYIYYNYMYLTVLTIPTGKQVETTQHQLHQRPPCLNAIEFDVLSTTTMHNIVNVNEGWTGDQELGR